MQLGSVTVLQSGWSKENFEILISWDFLLRANLLCPTLEWFHTYIRSSWIFFMVPILSCLLPYFRAIFYLQKMLFYTCCDSKLILSASSINFFQISEIFSQFSLCDLRMTMLNLFGLKVFGIIYTLRLCFSASTLFYTWKTIIHIISCVKFLCGGSPPHILLKKKKR